MFQSVENVATIQDADSLVNTDFVNSNVNIHTVLSEIRNEPVQPYNHIVDDIIGEMNDDDYLTLFDNQTPNDRPASVASTNFYEEQPITQNIIIEEKPKKTKTQVKEKINTPVNIISGNVFDDEDEPIQNTTYIPNDNIRKTIESEYEESIIDDSYEDMKYYMLEEIDDYQTQLIDADILKERKYIVTFDTPLEKIREIRKVLLIKYNRYRYTNMGLKMLELVTYLAEKIFDGKRSIGSFNLNLTGWSKIMKRKSLHLRSDIGICFESSINPYLTPGARIALDVIINGIIYGTSTHMSSKHELQTTLEDL
jgi:hypothetical protein